MGELRSKQMLEKYLARLAIITSEPGCKLCMLPVIESFTYWNIVPNEYPYDLITTTHHMIQPKRHCTAEELTEEEHKELLVIKRGYINDHYDMITESVTHTSSIPAHFHLHLMVTRDDLERTS
jgi:lipopolysaccharide biosynthesis protein